VSSIELLKEDSPVRSAIDTFGDSLKTGDGKSYQVEVPKLDSYQLGTAIQWVEDHKGKAPYFWAVDEITGERRAVQLEKGDRALLEGKALSFYVPLLDAAHYLGITSLRWAIAQCIAQQLRACKTDDEKRLNERDDLSPKEKEAVRGEDIWGGH